MTYAPAKFEIAMSYSLGVDAFTREYNILGTRSCCPVLSISCDLCTCKVFRRYVRQFKRYIYKKIHYLTFDFDLLVKVTQNGAKYLLHHGTYTAAKFEVAMSNGLEGDAFTRK